MIYDGFDNFAVVSRYIYVIVSLAPKNHSKMGVLRVDSVTRT